MVNYFKILCLLSIISTIFCRTPYEYSLAVSAGYDDNAMRFSTNELKEAILNDALMGSSSTFDSYVARFSFSGKKSFLLANNQRFNFKLFYRLSNYGNIPDKKYWSGGFEASYKWGSYKLIKYSLRHLDRFYLRHYINKDIGSEQYFSCLFTDRDQSFILTQPLLRSWWTNIGGGFLQRYYSRPFTEFDLNILYFTLKINHKFKNVGRISFQLKQGFAENKTDQIFFRPSSFNRSYKTSELYFPITITSKITVFNKLGVSARIEKRAYDAENPNDPLHSGRSHLDSKYDFWLEKNIGDFMSLRLTTRYRNRITDSQYEWVKDLKSYDQVQYWFTIKWNLIYDKY
tara:strand:- start:44364 stop:45395 length:1032 start_codon:yes stop_codon:yes gene_type:complete